MRLVFAPDDDEKFYAAKDALVDAVFEWAQQRGLELDPFVVSVALDYKYGVDGRLDRWGLADMCAILTEWFPRKVTMLEPDWDCVAPSLHTMVDYLTEKQFMEAGGDDSVELHAEIAKHAPAFRAGMADERNYELGKFWATKMLEYGVDPNDRTAADRFMAAAMAGEVDVDPDVIEEIVRRQFFNEDHDWADQLELPPIFRPSAEKLLASAEESILLARLRTFTSWLGTGRTLTKTSRLEMADARELAQLLDVDLPYLDKAASSADLPEVSLVVHWAKCARLVRVVKGKLVPVKSAAPLLRDPIGLWRRAFDAFGEVGEHLCGVGGQHQVVSSFGDTFAETLPIMWLSLYTAGGMSIPVELLYGVVSESLTERFGFEGEPMVGVVQQRLWRRDITEVLRALEMLGAVSLQVNADVAEYEKIAELGDWEDPDTTLVELTAIGLWAVNQLLGEQGIDAPVVGDLATEEIDVVCSRILHAGPDVVEAELSAWVSARGEARAGSEVAQFIEDTDEPAHRLFALHALARCGESGIEAARRVRAGGGAGGAVMTSWLLEREAIDPSSVTEDEMLLGLADHLAAMNDQGLLVYALESHPVAEQVDLVNRLAKADHPSRLALLDAIAEEHPERKVAKAAGKTRLKLRTAEIGS